MWGLRLLRILLAAGLLLAGCSRGSEPIPVPIAQERSSAGDEAADEGSARPSAAPVEPVPNPNPAGENPATAAPANPALRNTPGVPSKPITPEVLGAARFPTPTATLPPPADPIPLPEGAQVFVLLGTDQFSPLVGRTDSIILAFLYPEAGTASLVSVPRDLYVYLPGKGMDRINSAYGAGGIELVYQTLEYNLGVRPQHWGLAHLDDFWRVIDELGGIDVEVSTPLPDDCGGIPPGVFHMDGATALCYVRSRYSTSDFDRSRRQQEVLQVVFQRFMSLDNLPRLPEWYARYSGTVQTDLTLPDLFSLAPLALRLSSGSGLYRFQIGWEEVGPYLEPGSGASVLVAKPGQARRVLEAAVEALKNPAPIPEDLEARLAELTPVAPEPPPEEAPP